MGCVGDMVGLLGDWHVIEVIWRGSCNSITSHKPHGIVVHGPSLLSFQGELEIEAQMNVIAHALPFSCYADTNPTWSSLATRDMEMKVV